MVIKVMLKNLLSLFNEANKYFCQQILHSSVSCSCRIHQMHLSRGKTIPPTPNKCPGYDIKQSYDKAPVMLELWGMQGTTSLQLLPGLLWPRVVAPDRILSMSQIELFDI